MNRRVFCQSVVDPGECGELSAAESAHLRNVLRARQGEEITLLDGNGVSAVAEVADVGGRRGPVSCRVLSRRVHEPPSRRVCLFVAPPRSKPMGRLIRQAVELGVWEIHPVLCERSVSAPAGDAVENWSVDAREACKQSGNVFLPRIFPPVPLQEALGQSIVTGYVALPPTCAASEGGTQALAPDASGTVSLWVGPEGGFTPVETQALLDRGLRPLVVGQWTLRVETAVTACLS